MQLSISLCCEHLLLFSAYGCDALFIFLALRDITLALGSLGMYPIMSFFHPKQLTVLPSFAYCISHHDYLPTLFPLLKKELFLL